VIEQLFREAKRFRFFQAVRLFDLMALQRRRRQGGPVSAVGLAADPRHEAVRFRSSAALTFPASEIVEARPGVGSKPPELTVAMLGLAGAMGPLPAHYAALAQPRARARRTGLLDFFDIFNHRLVGLFYAAWAKYRLPIAYERHDGEGDDGVTTLLRALVGLGTGGLRNRLDVADEVLLHYGGNLARLPRSAVGLQQVLSDYLGRTVRVEQFVGKWLDIPAEEQTRLSGLGTARSGNAQLGVDALIGERVWDLEGSFRLEVGPLGYGAFQRLMPGGPDLARLADLARFYAPTHLNFTIRPILHRDEVPKPVLRNDETAPRLGWNSWLCALPMPEHVGDAEFDGRRARV
jgi:type VI secretion system protein ImpH